MKISVSQRRKGFTLPEMTVGVGIFSILMVCYLSLHVACLRLYRFESTRFNSADQALNGTSRILIEMRGAYSNRVGTVTGGDPATFVTVGDVTNQWGDALQIVNTNASWICYYYVPASNKIFRAESGSTVRKLVASSVTNYVPIFQEENAAGDIRTNAVSSSITSVNLRFVTTNSATAKYFANSTNYMSFKIRAFPRRF